MARYVALVDGGPGAYAVVVPDLLGCTSAGATTDEALRNAVGAVRLWAEGALAHGEALPVPRDAEAYALIPTSPQRLPKVLRSPIVPLILDAGRPAKANLSLDAGLHAAIDEAVAAPA
jgi:predicted RNase H-like HicB family nuclease